MRWATPAPPASLEASLLGERLVLAVGSYTLTAGDGGGGDAPLERTGALHVSALAGGSTSSPPPPVLDVAAAAAVFDARWVPLTGVVAAGADAGADARWLLAATAGGGIEAHAFSLPAPRAAAEASSCSPPRLSPSPPLRTSLPAPPGAPAAAAPFSALAICWLSAAPGPACSPDRAPPVRSVDFAASRSDGRVDLCSLDFARGGGAPTLLVRETWLAHTHDGGSGAEVWAVSTPPVADGAPASIIWTGADDALLKTWDLR